MLLRFALSVCVVGLIALPLRAADDAKPGEIHSKRSEGHKCCGAACKVNFVKELGVPLNYLSSLGHEISDARSTPDPVALALLASNLAVAEKVSGKTASVKSADIQKEAVELAKMRGKSAELKALKEIVSDKTTKTELEEEVALAEKNEAKAKSDALSSVAPKALIGMLTVVNHSDECLKIYVHGQYVGECHTGETQSFYAHDHHNPTILQAFCEQDGDLVESKALWGHNHCCHWHIH